MATDASVESAAVNLNLNPEEKRYYGQLFRQADTGNAGIVTGEVAVKFFEKTRLDSRILGEIWQIADKENRGFLTPAGFGIVLRLIAHAQAGREPTTELAFQPAPLPRFDGFAPPAPVGSPPPTAASPIQPQGSGSNLRIPPLMPDKVAQYSAVFERQPLVAGTLPGDQAKQIFEKSGLPNEVLGRIWMLADTEQRGALVQTEFVIAMHLLTCMKTGSLRVLPGILPASLYEAATRRSSVVASPPPRQSPSNTGVPAAAIPHQMSGHAQAIPGSPLSRPPVSAQVTGAGDWAVSPADKAKFDQIFVDLDKGSKGYITGEEAVPFFSQSNLGEDALAQIWDLSDINSRGQLTREEFAVAMFLIRQQRGNRSGPLPTALPPNLIPPNMRTVQPPPPPPPQMGSMAFDAPPAPAPPPPQQPKSALDELFGLDTASSSPAPVSRDLPTGGSANNDPFAGGASPIAPSSPTRPPAGGASFKPFIPTSSFGRGLTHQPSGDSTQASAAGGDDLLGDAEPEESKKISGESTELANLSNQISSLAKQTQDTQAKRSTTQTELNQTNSQKQNFEQRLTQLRNLYEKEAEDTRALEERLRKSQEETRRLQSDCMALEGTYGDVRTQHQQIAAALQADQQENARLRERIRVVNGEIAQIKPQIEKLKSDARQQKGLVAINKKQLSTTEGERDKLKGEADDLSRAATTTATEEDASRQASPPPTVGSPAPSTASGNNPFFKRTASTDIMGAFASPAPRPSGEGNAFDDMFGPTGSSSTPPPPTSFKTQDTGASGTSASSAPTPAASSPNISRQATFTTDPPAPPESSQMSSSFLPLPEHSDSLSSSRQVSPPASRAEDQVQGSQGIIPGAAPATDSAGVPGAFPGDDSDDKQDTPSATPAPDDAPASAAGEASKAADPFSSMDQSKAKEDFDSAFAAFSSSTNKGPEQQPAAEAGKGKPAFDTEFPPISELHRDDESDSDSDSGGFDDDFAPASPEQRKTADKAADETPKGSTEKSTESTPTTADQTGAMATASTTAAAAAAPAAANPAQASENTSKGGFDDLDDDFEGLEDAKEGSADDDFANISRSGLDDFNPVFDSSPPPSQSKSESTAFGNESSFDFISSNTAATSNGGQAAQKGADSHDWDAIFAGLDSTDTAAAPAPETSTLAPESRPPAPGRALTDAGEHDDPILKDLMGLGYSRADSVAALEKYDYNLEKAANYLAISS